MCKIIPHATANCVGIFLISFSHFVPSLSDNDADTESHRMRGWWLFCCFPFFGGYTEVWKGRKCILCGSRRFREVQTRSMRFKKVYLSFKGLKGVFKGVQKSSRSSILVQSALRKLERFKSSKIWLKFQKLLLFLTLSVYTTTFTHNSLQTKATDGFYWMNNRLWRFYVLSESFYDLHTKFCVHFPSLEMSMTEIYI